jgi:hypothetical protein
MNYNPNKTLPETFYKKNSDFCTKNRCQFLKKPIKPKKPALRWVFLGVFFLVLLGGFYIANPVPDWLHEESAR